VGKEDFLKNKNNTKGGLSAQAETSGVSESEKSTKKKSNQW
jgi:hypothetical protein